MRLDQNANHSDDANQGLSSSVIKDNPTSHQHLLRHGTSQNMQLRFIHESFHHIWKRRPSRLFMLPLPHKHGDAHMMEMLVNVLTSIPFIVIGAQAPRREMASKVYANSVMGIGVASSLYHTSRGETRQVFRWGDYAMISTSALCLTRALQQKGHNECGPNKALDALLLASAFILPFKPSLVTAIHIGLSEVTFYNRVANGVVQGGKRLRQVHVASSILGGALFVTDGLLPNTPFIHAGWHLAAAMSVATYSKLLK